jgi:ADP-ribose pyrophosphatase
MASDDRQFEIIGRERVHDGFIKLDRYRVRQRELRGGWTPELTREVVAPHAAVGALCYDPDLRIVVLIEQARLAAGVAGGREIQTEIVAGITDPGELPEAVARREIVEETGLIPIGDLIPIARFFSSPGHSSELVHLFCARVDASGAGGIHGLAAEHEQIRVLPVGVEDFEARLLDGRIENAFTLIAGFWFLREKVRLDQVWRAVP